MFASGTLIATATGEVEVSALAAGDLLPCLVSGRMQTVVWVGHRRVNCRAHPRPVTVWPVRVAAHAFGHGEPRRDLLLSPDHAVYVYGVLIPIRCLINGTTIAQVPVDSIVYHHVELPAHDVLLAGGLAVESWPDTGDRRVFSNGGAAIALHPDLAVPVWQDGLCAPLVTAGPLLRRVRTRVRGGARRARRLPTVV